MVCKNCENTLGQNDRFCGSCGAKVIQERITLKMLWSEFANNVLGWDNRYFYTIRHMITKPEVVLNSFLKGVRRRYMAPFAFLFFGMTLSIIIFNTFSTAFTESQLSLVKWQTDFMAESLGGSFAEPDFKAEQLENGRKQTQFTLRYFNILTVLLIPIYSFLSFLVFDRKHTYAEHLIINCYLQGITFLGALLFFTLSILITPLFYQVSVFFIIGYYLYGFIRLYKLSFLQAIGRLGLFFVLIFGVMLIIGVVSLISGIAFAYLNS